ncbi:hypothetical protein BGZ63DRAFT_78458 [Mariannaea sp. PMI_226]|nr:hypothetical protein BGZ63DRAFT_78458 [Mariannaea sp. PMI_226]
MDPSQAYAYERPRPSYPRTASRSSTSTTNTRTTSQSAGSSTSQIDSQMTGHPAHRFHHAPCKGVSTPRTTTPRATPRLSREASSESNRQTAVSSFLQERLQKERQVESEKAGQWARSSEMNSSSDLSRTSHGSPTKGGDVRRPQSTAGTEGKKKGLGVKDMEQVISSLHKQNFDLKLELYHRRERQTTLEERVEKLESEYARVEESNEKLLQEMEKRDKAIEEAVAMIVMLEARLEQCAQERDMVQQIEAEGLYGDPRFDADYEHPIPKQQAPDLLRIEDDAKVITRMPSFLSERSETTENLRNVYLGVRGSVLSLPQVPESGYADNNPANVLASPSLSVLSESSFVSVYGQKGDQAPPAEVDEPLSLDGAESLPMRASAIKRPKTSLARIPASSNRPARSNSLTNTTRRKDYQSLTHIIDQGSPLQQIERLDPAYTKKVDSRPPSRDRDAGPTPTFSGREAQPPKSPARRRAKEEKRESLRRVLTDAPGGGVRLHDLPPTPDTISSSTLRRFQNSNETLPKPTINGQHSYGDLSDMSGEGRESEGVSLRMEATAKPLERARDLNNHAYFEARARAIQRPRSADETTISNRRNNDWDSDSEDDLDTQSLRSSVDIWMRESAKPETDGRMSPDLFSFPSTAAKGDWAVDAMFGAKSAYIGKAGIDPERLLEMFPVHPDLFSSSLPPPPPNRRSSLHAQTGNSPGSRPSTKRGVSKTSRRTRGRRNSDDIQMRAGMKTPVQPASLPQPPPATEQKKQYPPITGQGVTRSTLTKLFRRSLGGSAPTPPALAPALAPSPIEPDGSDSSRASMGMGVPSWVNRPAVVEDDRDGATPPPIMRNPRHSRQVSVDLAMIANTGVDLQTPGTPTMAAYNGEAFTPEQHLENSPRVSSATGTRRKWLPAFRAASFKPRTG